MELEVKKIVLSCGADVCGISSIEQFKDAPKGFSPIDIMKNCRSVIAFGVALPKGVAEAASGLVYSRFNSLVCDEADTVALKAAKIIEARFTATAVPVQCDGPYDYWETETLTGKGIISMKHTAVLCGLGEIGKSGLLINPEYGNLLTVGAILTDMEFKSDDLCEKLCIDGCTKCIDSCPTHAIKDDYVVQKLCRENAYGKNARGFDTVNCNKCRMVCPMRNGKLTSAQKK